ncbi:MAG: hypothetical protein QOJ38_432 [Solirubrobacterales bacterium]|jgi:hypothetical protein|nr:hypothetical protein [Solirubrobacterales bacterium]
MARVTIYLPDAIRDLVRELAEDGESFSATVTRLIESGARESGHRGPAYIGAGEGPGDLGLMAERYLRELDTEH